MWSENPYVCMLSVCFQLSLTGILVLCFIKRGNRQGYMVSHLSDTGNPKYKAFLQYLKIFGRFLYSCAFLTDQTEWRFVLSVSGLVRGGNRVNHRHSHEPTADLAGVPLPGVDADMHLLRRDHRSSCHDGTPRRSVSSHVQYNQIRNHINSDFLLGKSKSHTFNYPEQFQKSLFLLNKQ